ncbi:MAG: nucleotide sugar dehydrogenase [Acidobacteriota bacterium]
MQEFLNRIEQRALDVCVVGLGYVGLPLAVAFAETGFAVTGLDVNEGRVKQLNAGKSYIGDVPSALLADQVDAGRLVATTDAETIAGMDVVVICVPTPLSKTRDPDVSYILAAAGDIARHFHLGMLVVMESTTYPGTTEEVLLPALAANGAEVGKDFHLAFSPERIDPGNKTFTLSNTPKIVGGYTESCGAVAAALYATICERVHRVSSCRAAEMVKLLENTYRAVNIALVNEVAMMCERLEIDTWDVINAAATKPFGYMPFYPGPGLGGHCIPVDPHYLTWKLRTLNYQARLVELASEINAAMPEHVVRLVADALNERSKSVKGSRILVLGVAYKRNIDDVRESPALDIIRLLQARGARVEYSDPFVPAVSQGLENPMSSTDGLPGICRDYDCVVVTTDHSDLDWPAIIDASALLIDTRNVSAGRDDAHIVRL